MEIQSPSSAISSVQSSRSAVSSSLPPHGLQHSRPPCPSPAPRVYRNSCVGAIRKIFFVENLKMVRKWTKSWCVFNYYCASAGLSRWLIGKESTCQYRRQSFSAWVAKIPWRRKWQPTPVFLPGKFHGQRSLAGCHPRGRKESDTTQ